MLLPALARRLEVTAVVRQPEVTASVGPVIDYARFLETRSSFDAVVCQIGNNLHHEYIFEFVRRNRSIVVLHDLVLHHLIAESTIARGDTGTYVAELSGSEGAAGAAYARGRAAGFHLELANFLFPAVTAIAQSALRVIVHNDFARRMLLDEGVTTPIDVIAHPHVPRPPAGGANRESFGYSAGDRIIVCLGFITESKQPAAVLEAFRVAAAGDASLHLLFAGEPADTIDMEALMRASGVDRERVKVSGYLSDDGFDACVEVADAVVNLRYPTAGESSGPLVRVLAAGKPVAVSDYAQFGELPDDIVTKIPLDDVPALATFMLGPAVANGQAVRAWVAANTDVDSVAARYEEVIRASASDGNSATAARHLRSGLPLFPGVTIECPMVRTAGEGVALELTLRNGGDQLIRGRDYGQPVFNLIGRAIGDECELETVWMPLSCDLPPLGTTTLTALFISPRIRSIELFEALTGIPFFPRTPLAVVEVVG